MVKKITALLFEMAAIMACSICVTASTGDYILPEADTKFYTADEIGTMPIQVTCYARNEIYARHGRKFVSKELQEYFSEQPWYRPRYSPSNFPDDLLNDYEEQNVYTLLTRERNLSYNMHGYDLDQPGYDFSAVEEYLQEDPDDYNILQDAEVYSTSGSAYISTEDFFLILPAEPKWSHIQLDRESFQIYYAPAKMDGCGGNIVTIKAYDLYDDSYEYLPSYSVCGKNFEKRFVAIYPTDVQFNAGNKKQSREYKELLDWAYTLDEELDENPFMVNGNEWFDGETWYEEEAWD